MNNADIKLILFDLGGVLVELGREIFPKSWFPEDQSFGLEEWFSSDAAIQFETGLISPTEFIRELKQALSLNAPDHQVRAAFELWPKGFFETTDELLNRLKADYELAVLSNSNEIHEPILMQRFGLQSRVDHIFFSHLIGYSKPSLEAYTHVLKTLNFEPYEVMFFDDNQSNVAAAKSLGIQAYQVFSPVEVMRLV